MPNEENKPKLTESEQAEILQFIAWRAGTGPEPDWDNMPRWLVECGWALRFAKTEIPNAFQSQERKSP